MKARKLIARLGLGSAAIATILLFCSTLWAADNPSESAGPSVTKGKPAGIEVGNYAPDFQLEPIEISADFKRWLGDKAPKSFEDKIMLSDFVGKAPIVLLFGSFT